MEKDGVQTIEIISNSIVNCEIVYFELILFE